MLQRGSDAIDQESDLTERWIAGVDGAKAGWAFVLHEPSTGRIRAAVARTFAEVLALPEAPAVIAVDIPIGIADVARKGGRPCDVLARARLQPRGSCVFATPSRVAMARRTAGHAVASAAQREVCGIGLTLQAYAILDKIAEVDAAITPELQSRVIEVHPELCFAEMAGAPLASKKKSRTGAAARRALLALHVAPVLASLPAPRGAARDDLVDAAAACWTAERHARGESIPIDPAPSYDARGVMMQMWR